MKGPVVALFCLAAMAWPQANPAELPHQELILTNVNVVDTRDGGVLREKQQTTGTSSIPLAPY